MITLRRSRARAIRNIARATALVALLAHNATAQTAVTRPPAKPAARPAVATAAPNVVLLLVNEMGWQDLSVPLYRDTTDANRRYPTPALEKLASSGVVFTDAYAASSMSTPTRVALLTGLSPAVSRVTGDAAERDIDSSATFPVIGSPGWFVNGLAGTPTTNRVTLVANTLPKILRAAGYRSIHVGTTGWSARGLPGSDAKAIGFDESYPGARRADSLTTDAIKAMESARVARKPFLLWLSYDAVRENSVPDDRAFDEAISRGLDSADAHLASRIAGVDRSVADVLAYLDGNGLASNTIVVVLSDHGGPAVRNRPGVRHFHNAPLRGGIASAYDGGLRVPMIVRWPNVARAGFRSLSPVNVVDLFPTIVRAAKVANAATLLRTASGLDLSGTLNNREPVPYDRPLLWHAPNVARVADPGVEPFTAVRVGKWKLIHFYAGSRYELYDVVADPGESNDLSLRQPEVASRLSDVMRKMLTESNALLPIDKAYNRPVAMPGRILVPAPPPL